MVIALTGGIASGKSTIATRLSELGAVIVDADRIAREVVEPGSDALAAIGERFGQEVLTAEGALDRPALASVIFADPDARAALNSIVHPAVLARSQELFRLAAEADPAAIVVYDVPLLTEARARDEFETVIVAEAPAEQRIRRLVELRGMDPTEARNRVASQASDDERRAIADHLIDTSGDLEHTLAQVDAVWATLSF